MMNFLMQVIEGLCLKTRKVDNEKNHKISHLCFIAKYLFEFMAAINLVTI